MPLVSAADGDGDGVEDADDECPDTVTQEGWTVADNGCSYPSYLDSVWMCIGGGIMVQDLSGDDEDECSDDEEEDDSEEGPDFTKSPTKNMSAMVWT